MNKLIVATLIVASAFGQTATKVQEKPSTHTVTLTVIDLLNIRQSFFKVANWDGTGAKRRHILEWAEPIQSEYTKIDKSREGLLEPDPKHPGQLQPKQTADVEWREFMKDKVTLTLHELTVDDLDDVVISAADIMTLKPLLTEKK